ncbi:hypothetical protein [Sulfurihydrogenibium sp. YO3AOP1]|uniref:hypothetical protein n=1 Tax=Sulfurihydrogenibium sp. (strain YO3AOP1) TaxID=436114 RepID=UPI0001725AD1|nr:hypothetical protein [Sulfurihydrogenibium sp. YO3AOP1]
MELVKEFFPDGIANQKKIRPQILPDPYKRVNEDYIDLLVSLVSNGYSESKIDSTLKSLGLNYLKTTYGCNQKTTYRKT